MTPSIDDLQRLSSEIREALTAHPEVQAAEVILDPASTRDAPRLLVFVVPRKCALPTSTSSLATIDEAHAQLCEQQVEDWVTMFENIYDDGREVRDAKLDTVGWTSNYTGQPVPASEMREWLRDTVEHILRLAPRDVLEIGVGTGMVLQAVAPRSRHYLATDVSTRVLSDLMMNLGDAPSTPAEPLPVQLLQRPAHVFDGIELASLDTIILNSVVQYFPSARYLTEVLEQAVQRLTPEGAIFVGDIRSLPLLPAFHLSLELEHAPGALPLDLLAHRVAERQLQENELALAPAYFTALIQRFQRQWPESSFSVEIYPKAGRARNEMNAFRYRVILRRMPRAKAPLPTPRWQSGEHLDTASLRRLLESVPPVDASTSAQSHESVVALTRLPNARLWLERRAARCLSSATPDRRAEGEDVSVLRDALEAWRKRSFLGFEPQALVDLGRELGFEVHLGWSRHGVDGEIDAIFRRSSPGQGDEVSEAWRRAAARLHTTATAEEPVAEPVAEPLTNDPISGHQARELAAELHQWLMLKLLTPGWGHTLCLVPAVPKALASEVRDPLD